MGKPAHWLRYQIFTAYHFVEPGKDQPTHAMLAAQFAVTEDQVRYALKMVQQRFERFVRQEHRDQDE